MTPKEKKAAYDLARRLADPERKRADSRRYYQANRAKVNARSKAWAEANADRWTEYAREWRIANQDKIRGYAQARRTTLPEERRLILARRRAAMHDGGDLTRSEWLAILEQFEHRCAYCGALPEHLELEHMTPLSRGGKHTATNIVPACRPCNRSKGRKTADEFLNSTKEKK